MRKLILFLPVILSLLGCPQRKEKELIIKLPKECKIINSSIADKNLNTSKNYINFSENNRGTASIGCNIINFTFASEEYKKIKIDNIYSTKMYCKDLANTENSLIKLLKQVRSYKIEGNHLFLLGENDVFIECLF